MVFSSLTTKYHLFLPAPTLLVSNMCSRFIKNLSTLSLFELASLVLADVLEPCIQFGVPGRNFVFPVCRHPR
jgi:hypothetical protein